jgi:hypothetical protein
MAEWGSFGRKQLHDDFQRFLSQQDEVINILMMALDVQGEGSVTWPLYGEAIIWVIQLSETE